MINAEEVISLLDKEKNNIICRKIEFRPQNIAMLIATLSNLESEVGYVIIGAEKKADTYNIEGIAKGFNLEQVIDKALPLLSIQADVKWTEYSIGIKSIYIIQVNTNEKNIFLRRLEKETSDEDVFIRDLVLACSKMQSRKLYVESSEDERNDFIGDLLESNGYEIKDQTRRGSSATGKSTGEVDILVQKNRMPFTLVEALNLNSLNRAYISTHIDKIYSYDTLGHKFNVCLLYLKTKQFNEFWDKYCLFAREYKYPVPLVSIDLNADNNYPYSEIRLIRTTHNRSGRKTELYHICVIIQE